MSYYPPGPPTHPSMPFGAVPPEPAPRNRRNLTLILAAIVAVLALVFASVVVIVLKNKGDGISIPFLSLTSADSAGDNPFTPNASLSNKPLDNGLRLSAQTGAQNEGTRLVSGTTPGLYAGGANTCDTAALGNYLANNPSQARAWASVFGISTGSIPYYLDTLSPVLLTADTWVTNYGYTGGVADPFQDVLQAGTAVLVDGAGVPRVRCACGNPLAPPVAAPVGGYRVKGKPWTGYQVNYITRIAYNTQNVTVVNNTTTVINQQAPAAASTPAALTLLNLDTGELFERAVGGLLDLSGQPALTEQLPTPASLNVPLSVDDENQAADNGLAETGSTQAAETLMQRAETNGNTPEVEGEDPTTDASGETSAQSTDPSEPGQTTATDSGTTTSESSSSSSAAPTPTSFTGSGDSIGSFTFTEDSSSVTCRAPSEETGGVVELTCSDSTPRSVYQSSLSSSSVSSSTDSDGVWSVSLTQGGVPATVAVTSATWQSLIPTTTFTTTIPTTTEAIPETTTEEPTVETTTPEVTTQETTTEELTTTTTTPAA